MLGLTLAAPAWTTEITPGMQKQIYAARSADKAHDDVTAFTLWRPLADAGLAEAQYHIGRAYQGGDGTCRDQDQAMEWLQKAADQGLAEGERALGFIYNDRHEPETAMIWLKKAADQGDMAAQRSLALNFWQGNGVAKDGVKALDWAEKAAAQGDTFSAYNAAIAYSDGKDVPRDYMKAAHFYRLAADGGIDEAMFALAGLYDNGQGVTKDEVAAYKWYRLASGSQGTEGMDRVEASLTKAQIKAGKAAAEEWERNWDPSSLAPPLHIVGPACH